MRRVRLPSVPLPLPARDRDGAALLIVLALVVLLTALVAMFLTWALSQRLVANSSANQTRVELFAQGAVDMITSDLKQEIAAGSSSLTGANGVVIFAPTNAATILPALTGTNGVTSFAPNLLKRSAYSQPLYSGANYDTGDFPAPNRAANISTSAASLNGRFMSLAGWNKSLLLPKQDETSSTDLTPISTGTNAFVSPDWILVARDGSNPTTWNTNMVTSNDNTSSVVGRYAYAIYNEGGLLDMNVAGYPTGTSTLSQYGYKCSVALADLTQLTGSSGNSLLNQTQIDAIVGWRNYATIKPPNTFPNYNISGTNVASSYFSYITNNTKGFLTTSGAALFNNQSDRMFASRQQLISFLTTISTLGGNNLASAQNVLQYMGTFSRELNAPTWGPSQDASSLDSVHGLASYAYLDNRDSSMATNRFIPNVRATADETITAYHADGSSYTYSLSKGAPLVQRRFPLTKLAWVTYEGPSALLAPTDPEYNAGGTASNIQTYFGLLWNDAKTRWDYVGPTGSTVQTSIATLDMVATQNREPNFMELLQAGILEGSLGLASTVTSAIYQDDSLNTSITPTAASRFGNAANQVIQIAANLIDQYDADSYPTRICFGKDYNGTLNQEFYGSENIPLINKEIFTAYRPQSTNQRTIMYWTEFEMWNPYVTSTNSGTGAQPTSFRIVQTTPVKADGTTLYSPSGTFRGLFDINRAYTAPSGDMRQGYTSPAATPNTSITVTLANLGTATQDPQLLDTLRMTDNATVTATGTNCLFNEGSASYTGIYAGSYDLDNGPSVPIPPPPSSPSYIAADGSPDEPYSIRPNFDSVVNYELDYDYGGGKFLPVQIISNPAGGNSDNVTAVETGPRSAPSALSTDFTTANVRYIAWGGEDPRTLRFGYGAYTRKSNMAGKDGTVAAPDLTPFYGKTIMWSATDTTAQYSRGLINSGVRYTAVPNFYPAPFSTNCASFRYADNQGTGANTIKNLGITLVTDPYYTDRDGVQRYADAIWNPTNTTKGVFPTLSYASDAQDRPVILNRPFTSVGEMRYAFRDLPFKSLDFSTARSGDAGLLDLFCIQEGNDAENLAAGKVDLNTRNSGVLKAILVGTARTYDGNTPLSSTDAGTVANDLVNLTASGTLLLNKANLATALGPVLSSDTNLSDVIKTRKEAAIGALATVGQTRTWNLMIDVVAQVGRYPVSATNLGNFNVEGEARYWVHVAIDRYTGKIIDEQLEPVTN